MCGIAGIFHLDSDSPADSSALERMTERLAHRGPDSCGSLIAGGLGFGFRRLAILDLSRGNQPMCNEDRAVFSVCNGEFFNYAELRRELELRDHRLQTTCDSEILPHLYEEYGIDLLNRLNGQFAFAIYDKRLRTVFLARDHFGVNPLFYTVAGGVLIFASEIKAILEHPLVTRAVDLTGLDQLLSLPGLVSPFTMFQGIHSLPSGHYLKANSVGAVLTEYWDLNYPTMHDAPPGREEHSYVEEFTERLLASIRMRLMADVPVGVYLSGGLDSSLIASMIGSLTPDCKRHSFSVSFPGQEMCEADHQRLVAGLVGSAHHEIPFEPGDVVRRLSTAVYHAECPMKETYNTACLALSQEARANRVAVILTGQGSDELFAGYVGYRFDKFRAVQPRTAGPGEKADQEIRKRLWGDPGFAYEGSFHALAQVKSRLYSREVWERFREFDCLNSLPIRTDRLQGRHVVHRRSYVDFKLRLADHLLADHGDRMAMANGVEARHPFLDIDLVNFTATLPPEMKLNSFTEKYIVKQAARRYLPPEITDKDKFAWFAPASPALFRSAREWMEDNLSYERIRRQGYFNPDTVERLKAEYSREGFTVERTLETDLLTLVLTFGMFLDRFDMPSLN